MVATTNSLLTRPLRPVSIQPQLGAKAAYHLGQSTPVKYGRVRCGVWGRQQDFSLVIEVPAFIISLVLSLSVDHKA